MLSKNEIAREIEAKTGIKPNLVKNVLDSLAEVVADEVQAGEDITIPGIAKIVWRYRKPAKKGDKYKKGDTVVGFGGVERTAEADSAPVKPSARLVALPVGLVGKQKPKQASMADFLKSKTGKAVAKRKG
jgi:nucleoid DNA-binding protein